ncbi:MAG: anthranilate phosphoribosyltransferase [Alphaproteobacteria bacterium]|nr:anthranilate phosphoribosyltransferase [Alphaproteobacteria bacterium]
MTADMDKLKALIARVAEGRALTAQEAEVGFEALMSGNATPAQMGGFLMALRVRGETIDEITGAATVMRAKALKLAAPADAMDIVGTGGDAIGTWNVSTATALVVAACGVPVAKHGNRALSSKSGAADVLTALGVNIDADFKLIERAIVDAKVGFMMAPRHHSAMRNVAGPRVELGTRTIFNLLGPLSNPALVTRQLVGVFAERWVEPVAATLANLGSTRAWVVHGSDGTDEITTTGPTAVAELKDGKIRRFEITPEDAGLPRTVLAELKGGTPAENAAAIMALFGGKPGAFRDIVLMNAAAALIIAGKAGDLRAGAALAARALDDGQAMATLSKLIAITNTPPAA